MVEANIVEEDPRILQIRTIMHNWINSNAQDDDEEQYNAAIALLETMKVVFE